MRPYVAEFFGTMLFVFLGNGVIANVVLNKSNGKSNHATWLTVAAGWGFALYVAILAVAHLSGAHLNPAITLGLALEGQFESRLVPGYLIGQIVGAFCGAAVVMLFYWDQFRATPDAESVRSCFSTSPQVPNLMANIFCEAVCTMILVGCVLLVAKANLPPHKAAGVIGAVLFAIGVCLGGPTGFAANPARDLGPRLAHWALPVPNKGSSDWGYAAVPVVGPLIGCAVAVFAIHMMRTFGQ